MYLLGDSWYKLMPKPIDTVPPTIMKPLTKPTWKYVSPGSLAISGIYTENDLEDLKDHIMFPAERPAVLNTIARGVMGRPTSLQGGSISNLLDKNAIEKIAVSTWEKFWKKFLIFGNISAGIMGIYLAARIFKLILDTLVHGYALHTVYGWSIYLLGAIWDSLTQLLLHLKLKQPSYTNQPTAPAAEDSHKNKHSADTEAHIGPSDRVYPSLSPKENCNFTLQLKE